MAGGRWASSGLPVSDAELPPGIALDPEAIARLRRLGGDLLARKMATLFLDLAPPRLAAAREGLGAGDLDQVRRAAHSLKSSAGNVGAYAMVEAAGRLEDEAERGAPAAELEALLAALTAAWDAALPELRSLAIVEEGDE